MKTLQEHLNGSLMESRQFKKVYKDFTDSMDALDWLEYEIGPYEYGLATIKINGKVGMLTFGLGSDGPEDLAENVFVWCHKFEGPYGTEDVTSDYESIPRGEFCDMVNDMIRKNGD